MSHWISVTGLSKRQWRVSYGSSYHLSLKWSIRLDRWGEKSIALKLCAVCVHCDAMFNRYKHVQYANDIFLCLQIHTNSYDSIYINIYRLSLVLAWNDLCSLQCIVPYKLHRLHRHSQCSCFNDLFRMTILLSLALCECNEQPIATAQEQHDSNQNKNKNLFSVWMNKLYFLNTDIINQILKKGFICSTQQTQQQHNQCFIMWNVK